MPLLDIDPARAISPPRDAATVVLVRDAASGPELFCVKRHSKSAFLGGAIVFPGGKVDEKDYDPFFTSVTSAPVIGQEAFADTPLTLRALATAACRELLEEAALLPTAPRQLAHEELLQLRADSLSRGFGQAVASLTAKENLAIDLAQLVPFARWVTPTAEARRFDTRFYIAKAPASSVGAHDAHETTDSFWARAENILASYDKGEIQLAPPTHRTLSLFASERSADGMIAEAKRVRPGPICPEVVTMQYEGNETIALTLPGDPAHSVRETRISGLSRFVLVAERWIPTCAPDGTPSRR